MGLAPPLAYPCPPYIKEGGYMNSPLEYILVGIVALGILVYLIIALLAPEKF
jgi:K+-transporting ATPase KdpF subunit